MTNETTASQPMQELVRDLYNFEGGRHFALRLEKMLASQPTEPHWVDGEQSALGGKTAREGYAANPEYAGLYPAASQPKSIGDDAHFLELLTAIETAPRYSKALSEASAALIAAIDSRAPAAQASATIQAAPTNEAILMARAEGRAEVVQMILGMSAETPLEEFTGWGTSGAPEDEGSAYWKADELRAHFACDDKLFNLFDRAEGMYWEALGKSDEAERMRRMVMNAAIYQPLHDFLTKHKEWDLMHSLQSYATIQEPVMVTSLARQALIDLRELHISTLHTPTHFNAYLDIIDKALNPAAPMVADPAGVEEWREVMQELVDLIDDAYEGNYEIDSFTAQPARILLAKVSEAATVKAVPSEALELAGMVVKATFGDHKILVPRVDLSGKGIGTLVYFAAPQVDKTGGGE